jgi:predicted GNAT superfamily acetyltransferase
MIAIEVEDKKKVIITYEDGRKVKYLYSHLLSENPDKKTEGIQLNLKWKEAADGSTL